MLDSGAFADAHVWTRVVTSALIQPSGADPQPGLPRISVEVTYLVAMAGWFVQRDAVLGVPESQTSHGCATQSVLPEWNRGRPACRSKGAAAPSPRRFGGMLLATFRSGAKNNAIRHFMWLANLTFHFGARAAKRLEDAHERGETGRDTQIDQPTTPLPAAWPCGTGGPC